MKYETGHSYYHADDRRTDGPGDSVTGVKYRFFQTGSEDNGYRISVYPQVETRAPFGGRDPDLTSPHPLYELPIEVKAGFGVTALDADLGREITPTGVNGWFGGFVVGFASTPRIEILAEARRQTSRNFPLQGNLYETGARIEISEATA